jgi:hypothetical protein
MVPGEWTNQFGFQRYSKEITGNIANKVTNIEFDVAGGGKTNMWMPFEMKQFELDRRLLTEEQLWDDKYNRDANGVITTIDEVTGEPVPHGSGVYEILKYSGNYDTYAAPNLTINKLNNTVNQVFANRVDKSPMEIVLYTGAGGRRAFNKALMDDASQRQFGFALSEKFIGGKDGYLTYGAYFDQYRTIDGYLVTVRESKMFNHGTNAQRDRANGNMIDGFPEYSYNLVFLDHSMTDDGERNIQLVCEEGREVITGIYKGMSPLPGAWGAVGSDKILSTKKDVASYEVMTSNGIAIKNWTTCFWLQPSR